MCEKQTVNWLFGHGLSIGCNLTWTVPPEWAAIPRDQKIDQIKTALLNEMRRFTIDCSSIHSLLRILANKTTPAWRHRFITTNWDYLLQKEILNLELKILPSWLANSHVFHLNGTIEDLPDNLYRSPFLLEEDRAQERYFTPEANIV